VSDCATGLAELQYELCVPVIRFIIKELPMRRDKLEIIRSILLICDRGDATKTKIVYKVNLNFKTAGIYLKWLIDRELIIKEGKFFKMTPKGSELLYNLQNASAFLDLK
jgi:predicted transcriptional regulator